jgi:hypothetical protein
MPQVPYNPIPTVQTQANPTPYDPLQPNPQDFGAGVGQAVEQFGKQVTDFGQEVAAHSLKLQQQRNTALFNETDAKMSKDVDALTTEFQTLQGSNTADRMPEFQQRLGKIRDTYAGQFKAPDLQQAFQERWLKYDESASHVFGSHTADQVNQAFVKSLEAKGDAGVDRIIRNSGFGNVAPEYDDIIDGAVELGQHMGWSKDQTDAYIQGKTSQAVQGIVEARLAKDDLSGAQDILTAAVKANVPGTNVPMMDGKVAASLEKALKSEIKSRQALARTENAQEVSDLMQSSIRGKMVTGAELAPEDEEKIRAFSTPKQYDQYLARKKVAGMVYDAVGDVKTKTNDQIYRSVADLQPKPLVNGAIDPEYNLKLDAYNTAKTMADQALAIRKADPSTASVNGYTQVRYALDGWQSNPDDPGHARSFVKRSLAAQTTMGLAPAEQQPLPKWKADQIAAEISSPNAQAAQSAITRYEALFGDQWDKVYRQVSPKMDPAVKVAATIEDEAARTLLISTSRTPKAELMKIAGIKDQELNDSVTVDETFLAFRNAMAPYGTANQNVSAVYNSIQTLALGYVTAKNMDMSEAVQKASKDVLGKYQFSTVNNQTFAVPNTADMAAVEDAAHNVLQTINVGDFDLPAADAPGQTEQYRRQALENSIRNRGRWVSSDQMKGVVLYSDRGPVYRYGRPVSYTWDQLIAAGQTTSATSTNRLARTRIPGAN